jgi:hypothetical protein
MNVFHRNWLLAVSLVALILAGGIASAAEPAAKERGDSDAPDQAALIKKLESTLTNAKLVGKFTVAGKGEVSPKSEEYVIKSAMKLDEGDLWMLKAQIKYGDTDTVVPIPLEIKWAGDTPVITLTNLTIPGMGTFTSRVVIYEGRYAGTWQHGKHGGNMFGVIEKITEDGAEQK